MHILKFTIKGLSVLCAITLIFIPNNLLTFSIKAARFNFMLSFLTLRGPRLITPDKNKNESRIQSALWSCSNEVKRIFCVDMWLWMKHGSTTTQETKGDRLKSLWIAYFKMADSKYFRLIVLRAFELVRFFNRQFDPRLIKSLLCWIVFTFLPFVKIYFTRVNRNFTIEMNNSRNVSWRFKFYWLRHLIVKL